MGAAVMSRAMRDLRIMLRCICWGYLARAPEALPPRIVFSDLSSAELPHPREHVWN